MKPPDPIAYHEHVTEQVAGPDFACRWASGVEFMHDGYRLSIPVTKAEWFALQKASGDTGFSNMGDFRKGVKRRYGIDLNPSYSSLTDIKSRLRPGRIALLSGKLTNMDDHYRRWYPTYTGGHTVYVACTDTDEYWWCDPGAPEKRASGTKYLGEPIDWPQIRAFVGTYGYEQIFRSALDVPAPPVQPTPPEPPADCFTQADIDAAVAAAVTAEREAANANLDAVAAFAIEKKR